MFELFEVIEAYEVYKSRKNQQTESVRIQPAVVEYPNNIEKFYDEQQSSKPKYRYNIKKKKTDEKPQPYKLKDADFTDFVIVVDSNAVMLKHSNGEPLYFTCRVAYEILKDRAKKDYKGALTKVGGQWVFAFKDNETAEKFKADNSKKITKYQMNKVITGWNESRGFTTVKEEK